MHNDDANIYEMARGYWEGGQPKEAGRLIFESLPSAARPRWASAILRLVLEKSAIKSHLFDQVLECADDNAKWRDAHSVFATLRAAMLELDNLNEKGYLTEEQKLLASLLSLAELVAKVTYNAADPQDAFDADAGWWIAACLRGFIDTRWTDDEFRQAAWSALYSINA